MIPPTTTGDVDPGGPQPVNDVGDQLEVGPGQDGDADDVDVLVPGGGGDLGRGEPDSLVDDLETGVPGCHGDLLGTVGMAVQPGLGHEQPGLAACLLGDVPGPSPHRRELRPPVADTAAHPGRGPVLAEDLPQDAGPLTGGAPGVGQGDGGGHDVVGALGRSLEVVQCPADRPAVAADPPRLHVGPQLGLDGRIDPEDRPRSPRLAA